MINGNDLIQTTTYRQVGDNDFRIATDRDIKEGLFLYTKGGLTKREYFAAMALQGCISSGFETTMDKHAESAIEAADALINALNETENNKTK